MNYKKVLRNWNPIGSPRIPLNPLEIVLACLRAGLVSGLDLSQCRTFKAGDVQGQKCFEAGSVQKFGPEVSHGWTCFAAGRVLKHHCVSS